MKVAAYQAPISATGSGEIRHLTRQQVESCESKGVEILCVPTNNGLPPGKAGPELVAEARRSDVTCAIDNGVSVIRADVAGRTKNLVSYGSSEIVDRNGKVVQSAPQLGPGLIVADIDAARGPTAAWMEYV
ncbi:MAG: carbon-nitrogen hydrolase family protein [Acidobacteria bacterium]|nr:MAG: carbon-nitrogen hydrolase family protein [Acidobacteriota bacterium]